VQFCCDRQGPVDTQPAPPIAAYPAGHLQHDDVVRQGRHDLEVAAVDLSGPDHAYAAARRAQRGVPVDPIEHIAPHKDENLPRLILDEDLHGARQPLRA